MDYGRKIFANYLLVNSYINLMKEKAIYSLSMAMLYLVISAGIIGVSM